MEYGWIFLNNQYLDLVTYHEGHKSIPPDNKRKSPSDWRHDEDP
jgi:hypothetical protein